MNRDAKERSGSEKFSLLLVKLMISVFCLFSLGVILQFMGLDIGLIEPIGAKESVPALQDF